MRNEWVAATAALMSAVSFIPAAMAQAPCVTQNMAVPPNANTSDKAAPFFIDNTGLDCSWNVVRVQWPKPFIRSV